MKKKIKFAHEHSMQIKYLFFYFLIVYFFIYFLKFIILIFFLYISIKIIDSCFFFQFLYLAKCENSTHDNNKKFILKIPNYPLMLVLNFFTFKDILVFSMYF
jgi:hypothetical protein